MAIFNQVKGERVGAAEAVTLVGDEAFFHGVLAAKGSVRVEGTVEGDVTDAVSIDIGKRGRVKGNIAAEAATVAGVVEGDLVCSRSIEILAGGRVTGNIRAPSLRIEQGAVFDGSCSMGSAGSASDSGEQSYQSADRT